MATNRRRFLSTLAGAGVALTPIAAALGSFGCKSSGLPEGLAEIKWDRDTCKRCSMAISDRRFASQIKGGPKQESFKFDDIGCAIVWLSDREWAADPATRIWVQDYGDQSWIDARGAFYVSGKTSPMGYNYAAMRQEQPGALRFEAVQKAVLTPAN
jgi:nitrous oxide reductase accessory protein NosL